MHAVTWSVGHFASAFVIHQLPFVDISVEINNRLLAGNWYLLV